MTFSMEAFAKLLPHIKQLVPLLVLLGTGYIDFAFCYMLCYEEIYKHHAHSISIFLIVLLSVVQFIVFGIWFQIRVSGPGESPQIKPYNLYHVEDPEGSFGEVPDIFLCDESGYPYWCTTCRSIKLAGVHHSGDMNRCIFKMDHYCYWIGTVIGENNYRYFIKFVLWIWFYFWIIFVPLIRYTGDNYRRRTDSLNGNFIVLYVVCVFWICMLTTLLISHIAYILKNISTLDDISMKNNRKMIRKKKNPIQRYVNIRYNQTRLIVQLDLEEHEFDFGMKENWTRLWLPSIKEELLLSSTLNQYQVQPQIDHETLQRHFGVKITNSQVLKSIVFFLIPFLDASTFICEHINDNEKLNKHGISLGEQFSEAFINHCYRKIESGSYSWVPKYQPINTKNIINQRI